ncbi:5-oxoprolinase subunit B family protein [Micromonosporaceae bacterium Da 78-11]
MRVRRVGRSALLIECRNSEQAEACRADLVRRREAGEIEVVDIVPGATTVLLDGVAPDVEAWIADWAPHPTATTSEGPLVEIPVVFDGEDLADVADRWRLPVAAAVTRLVETPLTVAFCGFAPGFAYLRGLREEWAVPRLAAPRRRVPAGAIGLAGAYAGIYPTASPGGWRLVGHTGQNLFDVRQDPPALLCPGTRVRLVPA